MVWLCKALLTMGSVLLVLVLARRAGGRVAGLAAALPTITGPALAWLAVEHGAAFAARAAVASVAAGAMLAAFAVVHAHVARFRGVPCTLGCALAATALLAEPVALASDTLAVALALAIVSCVGALVCLPVTRGAAPRLARTPIALTALAATGVAALTVAAAPLFGSVVAGLLASLPLVSGAVAATEHAAAGPTGVAHFLRGYASGLLVRTAFCATFAVLVVAVGWAVASAAAALSAAGVGLLVHRFRARAPVPCASTPTRPAFLRARRA